MIPGQKYHARRSFYFGVAVGVFSICLGWLDLFQHPSWTPDGFIYSQMMLSDAGLRGEAARQTALNFYLYTPVGRNPRYRRYFLNTDLGMFTREAKPFASRVLYPYLASLLYKHYGFYSLILVSMFGYVVSAVGLYVLLLSFSYDWLAAVTAVAFFAMPLVRALGSSALTDMLAICFWIWGLVSAIQYLRRPDPIWGGVMCCCFIGLALTRPAIYLPLGVASGVALWAIRDRRYTKSAALFLLAAFAGGAAYTLAAYLTHTPGLGTHLHWLYQRALSGWLYANPRILSASDRHSFYHWYVHDVIWVSMATVVGMVRALLPAIVVVAAVIGLYLGRNSIMVSAITWAGIFGMLGILANPIVWEIPRLVEAPLYPVAAVGIVTLLMALYHMITGSTNSSLPNGTKATLQQV